MIDEFLDNFMKARTSVGGSAREEFFKIFTSMYGGTPEDKKGSKLVEALAADIAEEE